MLIRLNEDAKTVERDITEQMRQACESIMPAIVDTTAEMIAGFDPEFQQRVKKHIIVAGGGSQIRGIAEYMEQALQHPIGKCKVTCVEDPLYAGSDGSVKLAQDMPAKYWEDM
jgi:rod shape-determining protein MreB